MDLWNLDHYEVYLTWICYNKKRLFQYHYPSWPGLAIFALIHSRHFSWLYTSSLLKTCHSRSFFMHSSHDFLGWPFFLFTVISSSITSRIWELMSWWMTWPYHWRWLWIISSIFTTTYNLSWRTSVDTLLTRTSSRSYDAPPHATLPYLQQ